VPVALLTSRELEATQKRLPLGKRYTNEIGEILYIQGNETILPPKNPLQIIRPDDLKGLFLFSLCPSSAIPCVYISIDK